MTSIKALENRKGDDYGFLMNMVWYI